MTKSDECKNKSCSIHARRFAISACLCVGVSGLRGPGGWAEANAHRNMTSDGRTYPPVDFGLRFLPTARVALVRGYVHVSDQYCRAEGCHSGVKADKPLGDHESNSSHPEMEETVF